MTRQCFAPTMLQDCHFKDVSAASLFWSQDGLVIADGLTFSNVTTEAVQWGATGKVVTGDAGDTVREYESTPAQRYRRPEAVGKLDSFPQERQRQLRSDDPWFLQVQQVCS